MTQLQQEQSPTYGCFVLYHARTGEPLPQGQYVPPKYDANDPLLDARTELQKKENG